MNWKIRLQLTKPATWVPLIWGVACGAAASGNYHSLWNLFGDAPTTSSIGEVGIDTVKAITAMILAGPFMCGFTQTINDWFDRDLDAINEPYRPIPSGKIKPWEVYSQMGFLLFGSVALACTRRPRALPIRAVAGFFVWVFRFLTPSACVRVRARAASRLLQTRSMAGPATIGP